MLTEKNQFLSFFSPSLEKCKCKPVEVKIQQAPRLSEPIWRSWKQNLKSTEYARKPVCWGAPLAKHFSDQGGKKNTHTHTHQSTQGLYKERSVVAKRQMQNNLHEKPDHDPSSSSSSQTVSPSPTQLLPNIKAHLCHIKAEKQGCWGRGGIHGVCFNKKLHRRFWIIP